MVRQKSSESGSIILLLMCKGWGGGVGPSISFPLNISEMNTFSNIIINSQFMNDAWSLRSLKTRTVQLNI